MKRFVGKVLRKTASLCTAASANLTTTEFEERAVPWYRDNGDSTLRLNYDLTPESLVVDLGGFDGLWAGAIFCKYCSRILIFEPVENFAQQIEDKFIKNEKVTVYQYGLAHETAKVEIGVCSNASSVFKAKGPTETISLIKASDFIADHKIDRIDLMKINIEGSEYDLIEHLIESGDIRKIVDLQVQFHDFVPNAPERMSALQQKLALTHSPTYQYPFIWENWHRKD